jgi:O-acetyl-ADP-ribose deacetylase (regulator of RNase III)
MSESVNIDLWRIQRGVIVQQVNCRGAMGRGLALAIRQKWPNVYSEYRKMFSAGELKLGSVQFVKVAPELYVCNLAGQDRWGTNSPKTDLGAYSLAWPIVSLEAEKVGLPVYAPWMFGCGLAGGDWSVVQPMIEALCPEVIWARRETGHTWEKSENYRGF